MIRKKLIVPIVLIVCCLLLGSSIGNTAETVTEIGVNVLKGSINGTCFNDVNQDGKINQGEQGIPGVTVTLRRFSFFGFSFKDVASIETDAEGKYLFSVNKAGIYQIEETDLPGSTSTTANIVIFFIGFFKPNQIINFGDLLDNSGKPSVSISANPPIIQKGQFSKLSWSAINADSVSIDQGIGDIPLNGELPVFPQQTTTFTITAIGAGGTSQSSVTVIVQETVTTSTTIPITPPTTTSTALVTTTTQPTTSSVKTTTTTSSVKTTTTTSSVKTTTTTTTANPTTTTMVTYCEYKCGIECNPNRVGKDHSEECYEKCLIACESTSSVKSTTTTTQPTTSSVKSTTTTTLGSNSSTTTSQVPTVITLASFAAIPGNREVMLVWVTESEIENAGFNIYRAETEDGTYVRLSASLIPAQGTATSGATYTYADRDVVNRRTYFYKLEDMDVNGVATSHGPVSATPLFIYGIK